jgi:hypothetical protein
MTKREERNQQLADDIKKFLLENELSQDTRIYFNNKCYDFDSAGKTYETLEDIKPSDYFEYANDNTVSMSFEGPLYEVLNGYRNGWPELEDEFLEIFEKYDMYYEMGNAWNLAASGDSLEDAPQPREAEIYIRPWEDNAPSELKSIQAAWNERIEQYVREHGDIGSCVLGAGFKFKYQGQLYKMPPYGGSQGSITWEKSQPEIKRMLEALGVENLKYDWGVMD